MIDEILAILNRSPILNRYQILQQDIGPDGAFILKVRCYLQARLTFQVWIKRNPRGFRYSYQLFSQATILRWDNAPHFQGIENYPHHFHNARGDSGPSTLVGNPLEDLSLVLSEVEQYLETQT